ncbi:MAG: hypothetical protein K0R49_55 [Burkholderiales bacterium]|jgi:hypothetical protein|nr:hypothetical protein [Burkholderiales bacterium]
MNDFKKAINWVKTRSLILSGFIKNARFNNDGNPSVTTNVNNINVIGNNRQNVACVFPHGYFSVPKDGVNAVLLNTGDTGSNPLVLGVLVGFDNLPYTAKPGESGQFSDNWLLVQQNDAIRAYKLDDEEYNTTLPSGEWLGKYLTDILNRLGTIEEYLNNHTHAGVQTGSGISGAATSPIAPDPNIDKDKTSIQNEEYLLNNSAKPISSEFDIDAIVDY